MAKFSIDTSELQRMIATLSDKTLLPRIASNSLYNASEDWAEDAQKNPGFKSGTSVLAAAIDVEVKGLKSNIFVDSDDVPYAPYVHDGTGIYGPKKKQFFIGPKDKKALSWVPVGGNVRFFSKGHMSDGQKPNPFISGKGAVFSRRKRNLIKTMQSEMTEQLEAAL